MDNPLVKRDLIDSILELREEVERQLRQDKYYIALHKLDELLAAIRPFAIIESPAPALEMVSPEPVAVVIVETAAPAPAPEPEAPAELKPSWPKLDDTEVPSWTPASQPASDEVRLS